MQHNAVELFIFDAKTRFLSEEGGTSKLTTYTVYLSRLNISYIFFVRLNPETQVPCSPTPQWSRCGLYRVPNKQH